MSAEARCERANKLADPTAITPASRGMAGTRPGPTPSDALLTVCIFLCHLQRCSQLILRLSGAEGKCGHNSLRTAFLGAHRVFPRTAELSGFISEACFELWSSRGLCQSGLSAAALHILRHLLSSRTAGRRLRPRQRQRGGRAGRRRSPGQIRRLSGLRVPACAHVWEHAHACVCCLLRVPLGA